MTDKLTIVEVDHDEAQSLLKVFGLARLQNFFPELVGDEQAHEAMAAMYKLINEIRDLIAPRDIEFRDFYAIGVELTNSEVAALLRYSTRLTKEDVISFGHSQNVSKEIINAMWCIKNSLMRTFRNIDPPLNW